MRYVTIAILSTDSGPKLTLQILVVFIRTAMLKVKMLFCSRVVLMYSLQFLQ